MSCDALIVRGRRVLVVRPRRFGSAARRMAASGWPEWRIRAALKMKRAQLGAALAVPKGSIWGDLAGVLAQEMRRAG